MADQANNEVNPPSDNKSKSEVQASDASSGTYSVGLDYDTALEKTIMGPKYRKRYPEEDRWYKRMFCGCAFQVLLIAVFLIIANEIDPLLFGLALLESEPKHFECQHTDPDSSEVAWKDCTKTEICGSGLDATQYRADIHDPEYIDNWVEKFDLLCEPKYKVGLIGSMYFIGLIATLTFVPIVADSCGRKWVFSITIIVSACAQLGLIVTRNLYELYVYEFLIGATFAGRVIVGLSYVLELTQPKYSEDLVFYLLISECIGTIINTMWYQVIDNSWFLLQLVCLIATVLTILFMIFLVPESAKWQYAWGYYDDSREGLKRIALFNGAAKRQQEKLARLKFGVEKLKEIKDQMGETGSKGSQEMMEVDIALKRQRSVISENQYIANVFIQSILWTAASFSFYMLQFMNKYFEGSIYLNYYLDSCAGICGSLLALATYKFIRMKWSFFVSITLSLLAGTALLIFQQGYISPDWVGAFGTQCPQPEGSEDQEKCYMASLVPGLVFFAKIGINATFQNAYQASFGNTMFPFYKKATAIGICNLVARTATVCSSLAAEVDRPWPVVMLLSANGCAFIATFFLPSIKEEEEIEKAIKEANEAASEIGSKRDDASGGSKEKDV